MIVFVVRRKGATDEIFRRVCITGRITFCGSFDRYANLKICMPVLSEWLADPFCVVDVFMSLVVLPLQVAQPGFGFYIKNNYF